MKLSTKLYSAVGGLALTGILVAGAGIGYLRIIGSELSVATGKTAVKLDLVNATRARVWETVAALRGVFLFGNLNNQTEFDASASRWNSAFKRIGEQIREIRPLLVSERSRTDLTRLESALEEYGKASTDYIRICRERKFEQIADLVPKVQGFARLADEVLTGLKDEQRALLKESQARATSLRSQSLFVNLAMSCLLLAIVIAAVSVVRGINGTLLSAVSQLSDGATQVAAAAGEVSSASQSLAQGASEQAASLEETSASAEEINSTSRLNSESARNAASLVTQSQQSFAQTNEFLDRMVTSMAEINTQSEKISKIIKVIDEIAFQTNILALNAAVEAARAGEAGMGFAVVADEVRNLAQRCAQAARDTAGLIEESIAKSNDGKVKVDQVATAIRTITAETAKVKSLVDQVNESSQQQAIGIHHIGEAMSQMDQVTQQNAAAAEQSASAAEELNAQSETLKDIVNQLVALVSGARQTA